MEALLRYFVEVNLAIAAFFIFYQLFLQRDTFFREKRVAFLVVFGFSLLYPLINLNGWVTSKEPVALVVYALETSLPEIVMTPEQMTSWSLLEVMVLLYGLVVTGLLLRFGLQFVQLVHLMRQTPREERQGIHLIRLPKGKSPFTFLGWLFIHPDSYTAHDLDEIIQHERAHIQQFHSFDVILAECISLIFWINPFVWLLKQRLRENLEYLADLAVIKAGFDTQTYQYHLLRLSCQGKTNQLANHFNLNQLKKRIIMMNKKRTSLLGLGKYAMSLPLFAFFVLATQVWGERSAVSETGQNVTDVIIEEKPLQTVEVMPIYPGGDTALVAFVISNLRYPASAQGQGVEGRVVVRFVVGSDGVVKDVKVLRGLDKACDDEAVRVIKAMPAWTPGKQKGEPVAVFYTLPLVFKLQKKTSATVSITE